jgi:hypothetical protein
MLFADKKQVEYGLEVSLLKLRKKELDHFVRCCDTLSRPAALLAGFAYTGIAVSVYVPRGTHWLPEVLYYTFTVASMVLLIHVTVRGTMISVLGPTLALRGRDSQATHQAAEQMERLFVGMWTRFIAGSICWIFSTIVRIYVHAPLTLAIVVGCGILLFMLGIWRDFLFVLRKFGVEQVSARVLPLRCHCVLPVPVPARVWR